MNYALPEQLLRPQPIWRMARIRIRYMFIQMQCNQPCTIRPFHLRKRQGPFQEGRSTARPTQLLRRRFPAMWCMVRTRVRQIFIHRECNREHTVRPSPLPKRDGLQGLGRAKTWAWRMLPPIRRGPILASLAGTFVEFTASVLVVGQDARLCARTAADPQVPDSEIHGSVAAGVASPAVPRRWRRTGRASCRRWQRSRACGLTESRWCKSAICGLTI